MISVIICSVDKALLAAVKDNIKATIGVEHEIIAIDNLQLNKGICAVYNEGANLAMYPLLCFLHEDILLKTKNWGERVLEIFIDQNVGLLGIAGSTYRSVVPSGWFPPSAFCTKPWRLNIDQGSKYQDRGEKHEYFNPRQEKLSKVACIDGVWFCTTKKIAQSIKFDEQLLKGFHGYDIDFSLAVNKEFKILVTYDVLLTHSSDGNFDDRWLKELIKVQHKHYAQLPINYEGYSDVEAAELENKSLKCFIKEIIKNKNFSNIEIKNLLKVFYKQGNLKLLPYIKFIYKLLRR